MSNLSIVVPYWPIDEETDKVLRNCLLHLPSSMEKVIIYNEGTGFAKNVNRGIINSSGEYIAVVNSDTILRSGNIYSLCIEDTVCSPFIRLYPSGEEPPRDASGFHGSFWVAPRRLIMKVGLLDERFEGGFFEDEDFLRRVQLANYGVERVNGVEVDHLQSFTWNKVPEQRDDNMERNQKIFEEKWDPTP